MQRKAMIILILIVFMVYLNGCGKKDISTDAETNDKTVFSMQGDSIIDKNSNSQTEEQLDEEKNEEPVKFVCKDIIKSASPDSGLVQIDDMVFQYGSKFSEVVSEIDKSECTYEAEYNVSSVVPAGESLGIRFNKNGDSYFMICVENRETETVELNDCIIYSIRALNDSMESAYYAGFSDDKMTYSTIKEAMRDNEPDEEIFGSNSKGNSELGIMYTFPFQENEMYVYFIFDGLTNELIKFEIASKKYDRVAWLW